MTCVCVKESETSSFGGLLNRYGRLMHESAAIEAGATGSIDRPRVFAAILVQ